MIRYCSILMTAIMLSGCGNFLGNVGEGMISNAEPNDQKQAATAKQRPDMK